MIEMLKSYISEYEIEKAILVGRNIVNKEPNNQEAIQIFLEFLLDLANTLSVLDERREYLDQAKMIISFVEENADLTSEFIEWIMSYSEKALESEKKINKDEDEKINKIVYDIEMSNNKALMKIHELCDQLKYVDDQAKFDELMKEFINTDRGIEKDYLTDLDQRQYDELSKICSETISEKMNELEHNKNIAYNEKAVKAYYDTYCDFSVNESEYKNNVDRLIDMLNANFFGFDSDKLFSETVIYYQFVYSKIFEKLSDEGKLLLTHASVVANK